MVDNDPVRDLAILKVLAAKLLDPINVDRPVELYEMQDVLVVTRGSELVGLVVSGDPMFAREQIAGRASRYGYRPLHVRIG